MTFAQQQNLLTTHFSERISIVKRCIWYIESSLQAPFTLVVTFWTLVS